VGLLIAAIFAAAMSSISSELASLSTATVIDFYRRFVRPRRPTPTTCVVSRVATGFWGLFASMRGGVGRRARSLIEVVNRFGSFFYGSILGVFILAVAFPARHRHRRVRGAHRRHGARWPTWRRAPNVAFLWHNVIGAVVVAVPPVALLFWVHAVHAALARVLREATFPQALGLVGPLEWMRAVATLLVLIWLLVRIGRVAERWIAGTATGPATTWEGVLLPLAARTVRVFMPLLALFVGAPVLSLSPDLQDILRNAVSLVLIGAAAFLLYQLVEAAGALILTQYQIDTADNLEARKVYTQVTVLKRAALVVISIFTLASMLMVFESVRQFGTSILASAGVAGIIIGFAAQRSIATLLAGFQIAVTQPIRLDDVVIVENEWGRIEDITLTYVVVRIWDLRRLIVPITYFIEQPFQNWTRTSAEILGTVFLHVDYTVPLPALREELDRIVTASPHWDGKVKGLRSPRRASRRSRCGRW
jgi:small-conductance mechanosensitive channel